jgi:hypothetical protein
VSKDRDLRQWEMTSNNWDAICCVAEWLGCFRSATTLMSATKQPTLASVHCIFKGLQDNVREFMATLSHGSAPGLRSGLRKAHDKLSEYFYKFDESPYYV